MPKAATDIEKNPNVDIWKELKKFKDMYDSAKISFARIDETEKCEFIKANAPEQAWSSTDDGAGLLIKTSALREQARQMLVSAARSYEPLERPKGP